MRSRLLLLLLYTFLLTGLSQLAVADEPGRGLTEMAQRPEAPGFELIDSDGVVHRLSDYRGRVVIINFWATWCPPCRAEMPLMQRAWQILQNEDVMMLAINVGEDEDTIFEFTADYPVEFPIPMDTDSNVIGQWPVRGLPTTFVVDPEGRIVYRAIGGREWDAPDLLAAIRHLKMP